MKPYKLKHIPTGLYYQPHKHFGSNLSKKGKIYQTATNGLSGALRLQERYPDKEEYKLLTVYVKEGGQAHKLASCLNWEKYTYLQVRAKTKLSDWIKEEI